MLHLLEKRLVPTENVRRRDPDRDVAHSPSALRTPYAPTRSRFMYMLSAVYKLVGSLLRLKLLE